MDKEFFEIANRLGACRLLHGTENKEELMRLLLTPQGTEFCTNNYGSSGARRPKA